MSKNLIELSKVRPVYEPRGFQQHTSSYLTAKLINNEPALECGWAFSYWQAPVELQMIIKHCIWCFWHLVDYSLYLLRQCMLVFYRWENHASYISHWDSSLHKSAALDSVFFILNDTADKLLETGHLQLYSSKHFPEGDHREHEQRAASGIHRCFSWHCR